MGRNDLVAIVISPFLSMGVCCVGVLVCWGAEIQSIIILSPFAYSSRIERWMDGRMQRANGERDKKRRGDDERGTWFSDVRHSFFWQRSCCPGSGGHQIHLNTRILMMMMMMHGWFWCWDFIDGLIDPSSPGLLLFVVLLLLLCLY